MEAFEQSNTDISSMSFVHFLCDRHFFFGAIPTVRHDRVCIAKAAVNKSVCEDSHAEHVQFATTVSTFVKLDECLCHL